MPYNEEKFGREGTLGRKDETEVILTRYLGEALIKLNPGLPQKAYQAAIREITEPTISQSRLHANREKYNLLREGVARLISRRERDAKENETTRLRFQDPGRTTFCVFASFGSRESYTAAEPTSSASSMAAASLYGTEERPPRFAARL